MATRRICLSKQRRLHHVKKSLSDEPRGSRAVLGWRAGENGCDERFQDNRPHDRRFCHDEQPIRAHPDSQSRPDQFANAEIAEQVEVAAALGAAPGSAPMRSDHALLLTHLQQARGSAFDRMYVQAQLRGHRELLALNDAASRAGNPQEQQVAQMSLPIIQRHLAILNNLRAIA
jgi:hypothetical protein